MASYSCQVWLPATHAFHQILEPLNGNNTDALTLHPLERLHLSFLKWTLGVNKYTSNAAVWRDTGRYPLVIKHAQQAFAYLERLEKLDKENSQALVRHAFKEQENSALDWLSGLRRLKTGLERVHKRFYPFPSQIHYGLKAWFEKVWNAERQLNRKRRFYHSIKETFGPAGQNYISAWTSDTGRANILPSSEQVPTVTTSRLDAMARRETQLVTGCVQIAHRMLTTP